MCGVMAESTGPAPQGLVESLALTPLMPVTGNNLYLPQLSHLSNGIIFLTLQGCCNNYLANNKYSIKISYCQVV